MTTWFLRLHDINGILDLKPLTNILGHSQRIISCNNLMCMGQGTAYTQKNSLILEEV